MDKSVIRKLLSPAFICLLAMQCIVTTAFAQEKSYPLEPVVITADRENEDVGGEPVYSRFTVEKSSQTATQVFTRSDIEKMNPKSVIEVIDQGLGMSTTFYGRKFTNQMKSRGGDSMGVILDGIYLPWSQYTRILCNFPVEYIESVEIVRDATALSLGPLTSLSSASGTTNQGFVIIKTRRPSEQVTELKAGYGSYNTQKYYLFHGAAVGAFTYSIGYNRASTDGKPDWYNASSGESYYLKGGYKGDSWTANLSITQTARNGKCNAA